MESHEEARTAIAGSGGNAGNSGACLHRRGTGATERLSFRHRHCARGDPRRRPLARLSRRRAGAYARRRELLAGLLPTAPASIRPRSRGRAARSAANGNAICLKVCREHKLLPRLPHRHRSARPALRRLRLAALAAPRRARHARHRPCRLRRVLRHHRETRRPDARRRTGHRRRRQARRRRHLLLYRPHLRREIGDADVRGACGCVRRPRWSGPIWKNTPKPGARCAR